MVTSIPWLQFALYIKLNFTKSSTCNLYYYYYYRISHFSASAGKHSPILGLVINRIRLDGLIYNFKKFPTIEHVPRITDFCICMYVFGCRLSLFILCDSDFGNTPVDGVTNGITWAVFCQFLVFVLFSGYCFGEIIFIWDSYVYQKGVLCFLIHELAGVPGVARDDQWRNLIAFSP